MGLLFILKPQLLHTGGDNSTPNPQPVFQKMKCIRTHVKTLSHLAAWCGLPNGWLEMLITCSFKFSSNIPIFINNDKAFA
jgi:hypothetical protein